MEVQVTQRALVERARSGDGQAFAKLTSDARDGCLRYALAVLGDVQLAEDAVQEALAAAYLSLDRLRNPDEFVAWLHSIVRFQCYRTLRRRHVRLVSLDHALDLPGSGPGPEEHLEQQEWADRVRQAVEGLPRQEREVVQLFYFGELSQREVASTLDMPISTVNNRLHAARQRLKGGLQTMVREDVDTARGKREVTGDFGVILTVHGPVFEARFDSPQPRPMAAIEFADAAGHGESLGAVVQQLDKGIVRCVSALDRRAPAEGAPVRDTRRPLTVPLRAAAFKEAMAVLVPKRMGVGGSLLETGIKAVDLLCPLIEGGTLGLCGGVGAGKLILLQELVHNLEGSRNLLSIFDFTQAGHGTNVAWQFEGQQPHPHDPLRVFYLPIDDPADLSSPTLQAVSDDLDAIAYLSHDMGREGLWPALDPLRSRSRLLETEEVSEEQRGLAQRVRELIRRYRELKERVHPDDVNGLPEKDRRTWERARRIENFLTQPFFSAEPYTKVAGQRVPLQQTLVGCAAILDGRYDPVPEEAFLFVGTIEQALSRQ
jgi:RNA polymerase sigma factor (sigma-70 family)